jgi:flavin reductase (DIM6/NTAB) family NADH-FMN oxidoreductase RutF
MEIHTDSGRLRAAFGHFATGVTVITAADQSGASVGMTVNSFTSLSLTPPLVLWSIAKTSANHTTFTETTEFAVHVLNAEQAALAHQFSARSTDRFRGVSFGRNPSGVPLLHEYHARILCRTEHRYDGGDHTIMIGRVIEIDVREGDPLVCYRGRLNILQEIPPSWLPCPA